jgi:hypothetical protein
MNSITSLLQNCDEKSGPKQGTPIHPVLERTGLSGPFPVICIQAAQTPLDSLKNMLARPALLFGTLSHRRKKLCRQHNLFAPAFELAPNIFLGSPDRLLGSSKWVGVGVIKEGNARIKRLIHNGT